MKQTDSGGKSPNETDEPNGRTIATNRTTRDATIGGGEPRWRFEWRNLKDNRRFPL